MTPSSDFVLGSFIGDALALGPHWIYDPSEISRQLGRVTRFHDPMTSYHPGKKAGDFTHYGDQMLVLLRSIAQHGHFDLEQFAADWRAYWENPATTSYRDGATKATLANLQAGADPTAAASTSHDLAGAAKIAPLLLLNWESDDDLTNAACDITAFTHGDPAVIDVAEFFTRAALAVQRGQPIGAALHEAMAQFPSDALVEMLDAALLSSKSEASDGEALKLHGLSCAVSEGFPGICHLLLRYPDDPATALIENASAGGDSAARGLILGMVYGAAVPVLEWPEEWRRDLNARREIEELISSISSVQSSKGSQGMP